MHHDTILSAIEILETEEDEDFFQEAISSLQSCEAILSQSELEHLLGGPQDHCNAILSINPGAGGTESMDWAGMLHRMYLRWAEQNENKITILDFQPGDEAGLKSVTMSIEGPYAYGKLKAGNWSSSTCTHFSF